MTRRVGSISHALRHCVITRGRSLKPATGVVFDSGRVEDERSRVARRVRARASIDVARASIDRRVRCVRRRRDVRRVQRARERGRGRRVVRGARGDG